MDSKFYFESLQRKDSFRDIVRVINLELVNSKTTTKYYK